MGVDLLQPVGHQFGFQKLLLFGNFQRQVRSHGVGELAAVLDLVDGDQDLRWNLLVKLNVLLELGDHGAAEGFHLLGQGFVLVDQLALGQEEVLVVSVAGDPGPLHAFDQHLDGAVGKLQQLQHRGNRADVIDVFRLGVVLGGVFLRHQQDLLVVLHDVLKGAHRFVAADEQGHDHVRKNDDVAKGKDGIGFTAGRHKPGSFRCGRRPPAVVAGRAHARFSRK